MLNFEMFSLSPVVDESVVFHPTGLKRFHVSILYYRDYSLALNTCFFALDYRVLIKVDKPGSASQSQQILKGQRFKPPKFRPDSTLIC